MKSTQNAACMAFALSFAVLQGCTGDTTSVSGDFSSDGSSSGDQILMKSFASEAEMLQQFRKAAEAESLFAPNYTADLQPQQEAGSGSGGGLLKPTTSGTNVQVQGVDEADLIKINGEQLFALDSRQADGGIFPAVDAGVGIVPVEPGQLKRFQLNEPAVLLDQAILPDDVYWSGMYLVSDTQQLILQGEGSNDSVSAPLSSFWWNGNSVSLRAIGAEAGSSLDKSIWQLEFDGRLVGSRRIGNILYVVTEFGAPYIHPFETTVGNVDELTLSDWLPHWQLDENKRGPLVSAGECYKSMVDERRESTRVTSIIAVPLDDPSALSAKCLMGTAETLFVSQDALYVATTEAYYGDFDVADLDAFFPTTSKTDLHKFSFNDDLSYRGGARLLGHLGWHPQQRSYRMGEKDGVLSVVTSGGNTWTGSNQEHRLYTLADSGGGLAVLSELPNRDRPQTIGKPGERVYGTRVAGDRVYVVTFLTTDPLYIIDVSDASDPFIAGELEVPGFSDYLQPVGDDLLLGIGKSAQAADSGDSGRGAWYNGLRLSLFDVADASNPTLINALEYGDRGSSTDVFNDFHALAWLEKPSGGWEFALPVDLYQYSRSPLNPWDFGDFVHRGLYRFDVSSAGIVEKSQALLDDRTSTQRDGRSVLFSGGDAWFYDQGELYYSAPSAPTELEPSQASN